MDFQELMERIKQKMLINLKEHRPSHLKSVNEQKTAVNVLPFRGENYIENLPSSFNPLMNHFKDEEKRLQIRHNVMEILKKIDILRTNNKLQDALEKNNDLFKELLASHFPPEEIDEQTRKLFTQRKGSQTTMGRMRPRRGAIFLPENTDPKTLFTRRATLPSSAINAFNLISKNKADEAKRKEKTKKELKNIIKNAKKCGQEEAKICIKSPNIRHRFFSTMTRKNSCEEQNNDLIRISTASQSGKNIQSEKTLKSQKSPRIHIGSRYYEKMLKQNLVLRTGSIESLKTPISYENSRDWNFNTMNQLTERKNSPRIKITPFSIENAKTLKAQRENTKNKPKHENIGRKIRRFRSIDYEL